MTRIDLASARFAAQRLTTGSEPFSTPPAAVRSLVAVQSQDYAGAKWALSLRTRGRESDADLDALFDAGHILRTHVLRPTWHFVDPADIRGLLRLTGPRVKQAMAFVARKSGLNEGDFKKSAKILEKALAKGFKTRARLAEDLKRGGVEPGLEVDGKSDGPGSSVRLSVLMMHAELDGLICSGPREGKQFTYALLDARVPAEKRAPPRDEALAELARRYCAGHGPARVEDLAWWSGLTLSDVRRGLAAAGKQLTTSTILGKIYWHVPGLDLEETPLKRAKSPTMRAPRVHLLPNYDEAFIAFKDRSAFHARLEDTKEGARKGLFDRHILFIDGQVAGGWSRAAGKKNAPLVVEAVGKLSAAEKAAVEMELERFERFTGALKLSR